MYDIYENVEYIYIHLEKYIHYYIRNIDKYKNRMFPKVVYS